MVSGRTVTRRDRGISIGGLTLILILTLTLIEAYQTERTYLSHIEEENKILKERLALVARERVGAMEQGIGYNPNPNPNPNPLTLT